MNLYRFKTFRTKYYFPSIVKGQEFLYSLYSPYGFGARVYWWLFRHFSIVRILNRVDSCNQDFPYNRIIGLMPKGCILSFNLGTPGDEQKISMLGLEMDGKRFFAKYSEKPDAMALSKHEIDVLTSLNENIITPELLDYKIEDGFCFFRTSYVEGKTLSDLCLNNEIVDLSVSISKIHIASSDNALLTGLSHGDFTPWNMLVKDGVYRMIDWEMANERPLGYDLFHFIYQVGRLFSPNELFIDRINTNKVYIERYFNAFDIDDWHSYYEDFIQRTIICQ